MTTERAELFDAEVDHDHDWRLRTRLALWLTARARRRSERSILRRAWLAAQRAHLSD